MSKTTIKLLIAAALGAGAIYLLNHTATNVKKMIDGKKVDTSDASLQDPAFIGTWNILPMPPGTILS